MRISVRHIQEVVAADFDIPVGAMWHPTRERIYSQPRQYAMLLARELTPLSVTVLGKLFDRDHSTICAGVDSARRRVAADHNLALRLEARAALLLSEPAKPQVVQIDGFTRSQDDHFHKREIASLVAEPAIAA